MSRVDLLGAVLVASCALGCASPPANDSDASTAPGDGGAATLDLEALPPRIAEVACAGYAACGEAAPIAAARCANAEAWARDSLGSALAQAIEDGRVRVDDTAVDACLASIADVAWCGDPGGPTAWLGRCRDLIEGAVADGAACGFDWECTRGSRCAIEIGDCGGVCAPRLPAGEFCDDDAECGEGLECRFTCSEPLGPSTITPTTRAVGEGCDLTAQGASRVCDDGLFCAIDLDAHASVCRGALEPGEPCTVSIPDLCGADRFCDASLGESGACRALPAVGEPCLATLAPGAIRCSSGLGCDADGTCLARGAIGDACRADDACWSGRCDAGACAAPTCTSR